MNESVQEIIVPYFLELNGISAEEAFLKTLRVYSVELL